jgi:protocatechuate 3,4-dioxygenase beta subunit
MTQTLPLTVKLRLTSANSGRPVSGRAVRLWHCDGPGGVQASDDAGWVTFTGAFPATHAGRWPHLHFGVYKSADESTDATEVLYTSKLALPGDACERAYAAAGYADSRRDLARTSPIDALTDGGALEMASVTGDALRGFVATKTVGF